MAFSAEILLFPTPLSALELAHAGPSTLEGLRRITLTLPKPTDEAYAISQPISVGEAEVQVWVTSTTAYVAVKGPDQDTCFKVDPEEGSAEILLRRPGSKQEEHEMLFAGTVSITSYPTSES